MHGLTVVVKPSIAGYETMHASAHTVYTSMLYFLRILKRIQVPIVQSTRKQIKRSKLPEGGMHAHLPEPRLECYLQVSRNHSALYKSAELTLYKKKRLVEQ